MRGLLQIEGSDGTACTLPYRMRFEAPSLNVDVDGAVVLMTGVSYHMTLLQEDGKPVDLLSPFKTDRLGSAATSQEGLPELVELTSIRVLHATNFGILCEAPGQAEEVFIPANHIFGVQLEEIRRGDRARFSVPAWFAREYGLI